MSTRVPALLDNMAERQRYLAARVDVLSEEVPRLSANHVREASCVRAHIARATRDALKAVHDVRRLDEVLRGALAAVAALRGRASATCGRAFAALYNASANSKRRDGRR